MVLFKAKSSQVTLRPGEFGLFFPPYGAHVPACRAEGGANRLRKLVIKVKSESCGARLSRSL